MISLDVNNATVVKQPAPVQRDTAGELWNDANLERSLAQGGQEKAQFSDQQNKKKEDASEAVLKAVQKDIELIRHVGLQFSVHDATGKTIIKVIDKDTDKLIREIPSEEILNLAEKIDEMLGILFDKTV